MGYYHAIRASDFVIAKEDESKALEAMKQAYRDKVLPEGVHYFGGLETRAYRVLASDSLDEAMSHWSLELYRKQDENGTLTTISSICIMGFDDFISLDEEDILFSVLAPFVKEGSFIECEGSDGVLWRWVFNGTVKKKIFARIIWEEPLEEEVI